MNTINGQVAPLRGLTPLTNVPRDFMNHEQLRAYFTDALAREWSPEAEQRERAVVQALDMDAGKTDLRQSQIDSMVKSVLGFYDQNSKQLVVVTDRAQMGVRDRVTYAHEFTHSLQDQHYNLTALFARAEGNSDYQMALKGLVEGDATLTMGLYARKNLTAMDIANYQMEEFQSIDLSGALTAAAARWSSRRPISPTRKAPSSSRCCIRKAAGTRSTPHSKTRRARPSRCCTPSAISAATRRSSIRLPDAAPERLAQHRRGYAGRAVSADLPGA